MPNFKRIALSIGLTAMFVVPVFALAQSTDVEVQIKALLSQILELQTKIATLRSQTGARGSTTVSSGVVYPTIPCACPMMQTNNVSTTVGCACPVPPTFCPPPIDYSLSYGARDNSTTNAVSSLQQFLGVSPTGYFGSITKSAVANWQSSNGLPAVGIVGPRTRAMMPMYKCWENTNVNFSATPTTGAAPLAVTFSANNLTGGNQYIVEYGDGTNSGPLTAVNVCMSIVGNQTGCPRISADHTYKSEGTYTATVSNYYACLYGDGVRCMMAQPAPLGSVVINVGTIINTGTLSISGLDAPTQLKAGTSGTWTLHVTTGGANLHYSVVWGDESTMMPMMSAASESVVKTSGTFTHVYATAGTYNPVFSISDDMGHFVKTSASVVVSN
ncbi:peptidoglycan-binding protein [Patescibacteria group bacterium]|nr:peptidoglycan-binding protein [Patescibacteria group bacterium]